MNAAVYARKSPASEDRNVSADVKSVTLQIDNAKAFAAKQGWTVADDHVYQDDQVSGGSFDPRQRPAFFELLDAAQRKPVPFEAVIVRDLDRWGRDDTGLGVFHLSTLADAGVTVFEYTTGQPILVETGEQRLVAHIKAYLAAGERTKVKVRTREALLKRAKQGWATGAITFGYDAQEVIGADGKRSHVRRVVNEAEAAVVRRIYELYANGLGTAKIAAKLNADGVLGRRGGKWSASSVRDILTNPLFGGRVVWGREASTDKTTSSGKKVGVRVRRDESEWVVVEAPDLRIVDEAFQRVQERLGRQREAFIRKPDGAIAGRLAKADFESKYLLGGFARCSTCGGPMIADPKPNGAGRVTVYYRCETARKSGPTVCTNRASVPAALLEALVVNIISQSADPDTVVRTVEAALAAGADLEIDATERIANLGLALTKSKAAVARLVGVIADGDLGEALAAVKTKLTVESARVKELEVELEGTRRATVKSDMTTVREHAGTSFATYRAILEAAEINVAAARRVLRQLGVKVEVHPVGGTPGARSVAVKVRGSYKRVVPADVAERAAYLEKVAAGKIKEEWVEVKPAAKAKVRPIVGGSDGPDAAPDSEGVTGGLSPPMPPRRGVAPPVRRP